MQNIHSRILQWR